MTFVIRAILFLVLTAKLLVAQSTLEEQFDIAKELFTQQNYFDAITEFKRLNYFDSDKVFSYESNLLIGQSYKAGGKYNDALKYFRLAEMKSQNPETYYEAKIFQARVNILRRSTQQAHKILKELETDNAFINQKNEIEYWIGWAFIFEDEWEKAAVTFTDIDTILATFCHQVDKEKYSVDFAKYSSAIIPGFGQFYTGEYVSGILSLGWNILWGYLTINALVEDRIFDGLVIGNLLWVRFYKGNIHNAEKFALQKNLKISNKALDYLQNVYQADKP